MAQKEKVQRDMSQQTIGQRIKYLMDSQSWSIRKFARALDVADTNIRNYIDKGTKPSSDVLEKLMQLFPATNPMWLLTGVGEPLLPEAGRTAVVGAQGQTNYGNNVGVNHGQNTMGNVTLGGSSPEVEALRAELAQARTEIQSLRGELARADALVAAKQETIDFMRGAFRTN